MPLKAIRYVDPDMEGGISPHTVTVSALAKMGKERQQDIMRHWFYQHYEDPVHGMPYDSAEGGYAYLNGGPFDAHEVLEDEFGSKVSDEAIEELVHELEMECTDWTRTDSYDLELFPRDDFYEIEAALDNQTPLDNLKKNLGQLQRLLAEKDLMDQSLHKFQLMMIYSFCITSLEAYLSDIFTTRVIGDNKLKKKYLQTERNFSEQKISLSQIIEKHEKIDDIIKKEISDTIFHNLARVKGLFKGVFSVDLGDISKLATLINKRHDFVHRGGKDKERNEVETSKAEVEDLILTIEKFCSEIDNKILVNDFEAII